MKTAISIPDALFQAAEDAAKRLAISRSELYVRAVITSSQPHVNPSFKGQTGQAWTPPVGWQSHVAAQ